MKLYQLLLISIFGLVFTSCSKQEAEKISTQLLLAEYLEQSNVSLMDNTQSRVYAMMQSVKRKPDYKALIPAAQDIIESTQKFIKDLEPTIDSLKDDLAHQQANSQRYTFHFLSGEGEKKPSLHHLNVETKVKEVTNKMIERLELISDNRNLGIRREGIEELQSELALTNFKIDLNDKTLEESYALLIALKNAALLSSSASVDFLASKIGSTSFVLYKFAPMSDPKAIYITKGETFETNIYLTQLSSYAKLNITVNGGKIPVEDGVGTYKVKPSVYGEHLYKTEIAVLNPYNGKTETYIKTFKYEVIKPCD